MAATRCRRTVSRWSLSAIAGLVSPCIALAGGAPAQAASLIQVTGTADETMVNGVCSLRQAVLAANLDQPVDTCAAGSDIDEIVLPSDTYTLTITGREEDGGQTGDLDLASGIVITGNGSVIDAGGIDRAIEVLAGASVSITGVTVRAGFLQASNVVLTGTGHTGGGIYNGGSLALADSTVTGNTVNQNDFGAAAGAGIANDADLTLSRTTISGNFLGSYYPTGTGGGVLNNGTLTAVDSVISGNWAWSSGGGLTNTGTAVITGSTVSGNSNGCGECSGAGGGISNSGDLEVTNSTISGNSAGAGDYGGVATGGGIRNTGTVRLINVTLAGNESRKSCDTHCEGDGAGGAIAGGVSNSGSISIANTIISGNTATVTQSEQYGGGSLVTPWDCAGSVTSQGYNLLGVSAGCGILSSIGDLLDTDPLLGPLQDNGGPAATRTHNLGAGSPAIDAGNPAVAGSGGWACSLTDQRGVIRPLDGNVDGVAGCDIGAVEASTAHHAGDNLLQNGSFERLLSPWIFRHDIAATVAVDTADGTRAAKVTVGSTSTSTHLVQLRQEGLALRAGERYTVRFWAKASGPRVINARLQSAVAPYKTFRAVNFTLSTTWQQFEFNHTSPTDTAPTDAGNAFVGFNLAQATGIVWLDQVAVYNTSNLVSNGGFESADSNMAPWIWRNDIVAGLAQDTTEKFSGTASARIAVYSVGPASHLVQLRTPLAALEPGRTYRVSFEVKGSPRVANVRLQSSDAPYPTIAAQNFNVTTTWTHVSYEWTPTRVITNPFLGLNLAQDTGTTWIDDVSLTVLPAGTTSTRPRSEGG